MSLNHIELKEPLITELYRGNLLATEGPIKGITLPAAPVASVSPATGTPPVAPVAAVTPVAPAAVAPSSVAAPASPTTVISPAPAPSARAATPPASPAPPVISSAPPPAQAQPASGTAEPVYKILGNNRRKITIVVQSPGIAFLPDDQLSFLGKMLEACKMNMGDVAIVNHATVPVQIAPLKEQLQPSFILLFGLGPVDIRLPMNFPVFKIMNYDQCTYLSSPPLAELLQPGEEGKLLKSKLWVSLKALFEI